MGSSHQSRGWNVRAVDGTLVKEPGRGGSLWRIHYSLRIPSLVCDHVELTSTKGVGVGERLTRSPVTAGDLLLAGRRYCTPGGGEAFQWKVAAIIVPLNTASLPLLTARGERSYTLERLPEMK